LGKEYNPGMKLVLALLCFSLFGVLIESFGRSPLLKGDLPEAPAGFGTIHEVGMPLFTKFALPFELVSILLIIAILGAVVLAKKKL
jgi:NADH-quinone oxidoreductase subunit J